ncbi:MAG: HAMP domain-containing protein [Deltaproteobacteria bacterium]|nr:HAMP domain-containing protein [Deltaproteobacteria bacterium]
MVFAKAFDLETSRPAAVPASLRETVDPRGALFRHRVPEESTTGLLVVPEGVFLVASRPIVTSEKKGPIRGTLVFGRSFGAREIGRLSRVTHLVLRVESLAAGSLPTDFERARAAALHTTTPVVRILDADTVAGYAALRDVEGRPCVLLRADTPRTVYKQGLAGTRYLLACLLTVGVSFLAITVALLEKLVLARLGRLSAEVSRIGASRDVSARVPVEGTDELSALGAAINGMLGELGSILWSLSGAADQLSAGGKDLDESASDARRGADTQRQRCAAGVGKAKEIEAAVEPLGSLANRLRTEGERSATSIQQILGVTESVQVEMEGLCSGIEAASLSVRELDEATSRVAAVASQVGAAAQTVAASATAIDRTSGTLRAGARGGSALATEVAERASAGKTSMAEAERSMTRIREAVDAAVERFGRLGTELGRVGRVTQVIDDIAGRTNLLSLNAAIIAAQAGEQGKAFGVVATEIRTLAEKTAASTREIRSIVAGVVGGANEAAEAVAEGAIRVAEGAERVASTRAALEEIARSADDSASRLVEIDRAAEAQTQEATRVAEEIREVTQGIVDIVAQVRAQEERTREIRRVLAEVEAVARQTVRAAEDQTQGTGFFAQTVTAVSQACEEVDEAIAVVGELLTGLREDLEALDSRACDELGRVSLLEGRGESLAALATKLGEQVRAFRGAHG